MNSGTADFILVRRYLPVALAIAVGVLLTLFFFYEELERERSLIDAEFQQGANAYTSAIQTAIDENLDQLDSVATLFVTVGEVGRDDFGDIVSWPLSRRLEIESLQWIPLVKDSERASIEAEAQREGHADFQIVEMDARSQTVRAADRSEYFPVYYAESLRQNAGQLGFDLASDPSLLAPLARARDTAAMAATDRLIVRTDPQDQYGVSVVRPVYEDAVPPDTVEQRRASLTGFIRGVFRIDDLLQASTKSLAADGVDFQIIDEASLPGQQLLYTTDPGSPSAASGVVRVRPTADEVAETRSRSTDVLRSDLEVAGRKWSLQFLPSENALGAEAMLRLAIVLVIGMSATALLAAYMFNQTKHTARVEGLVSDLSTANENLATEMGERRRAEEELESANAQLERRVAERVEELRGTNERLNLEIEERLKADQALRETNRRLEDALAELRQSQQQIIRQERMRALGQMSSGIAHNFNNALSPIVAYTDLLIGSPQTLEDKERVLEYLRIVNTAALDAAGAVKRLREFHSEPESDQFSQEFNLNELAEQATSLTQPKWKDQAQARGVTIQVETDLAPVPTVSGTESEIREVLTNLIFNSADAMEEDGTISVRTRTEGEQVTIEVGDTGVGMSEETRRRCMDPFFTTKDEGGTGLGLAVTYGIIERHQGTIEVESELGKGTTFTIRLPMKKEATSTGPTESGESAKPVQPLNVLAVDDDAVGLRAISDCLAADGHAVETAKNGQEALEKFEAAEFDIVVTDRAMPHMNGDQLAAAIKRASPSKPVIMVSGFGDIIDESGEQPANIDLVVAKPVTLSELRNALEQVTQGTIGRGDHESG